MVDSTAVELSLEGIVVVDPTRPSRDRDARRSSAT
jgi:hypothetical protein